jgi:hypothetical protein
MVSLQSVDKTTFHFDHNELKQYGLTELKFREMLAVSELAENIYLHGSAFWNDDHQNVEDGEGCWYSFKKGFSKIVLHNPLLKCLKCLACIQKGHDPNERRRMSQLAPTLQHRLGKDFANILEIVENKILPDLPQDAKDAFEEQVADIHKLLPSGGP